MADHVWNLSPVATDGRVQSMSLAIAPGRTPAVAAWSFTASNEYVLYHVEGQRPADTITTDTGAFCSFAIGPGGQRGIAFVDLERGDARCAMRSSNSSAWSVESVGHVGGFAATAPALAYAGATPEILYSTGDGLMLATRSDDGAWTNTRIDPSLPPGLDIAYVIDAAGNRHGLCRDPFADALIHLTQQGDGWVSSDIPWRLADSGDFLGDGPSLATDVDGRPHVAYWCRDGVAHASRSDDGWTTELVITGDGVGPSPKLAVDSAGQPLIASLDTSSAAVRLARRDELGWEFEDLRPADHSIGHASAVGLALDDLGVPHVAFVDSGGRPYVTRYNTAPVSRTDNYSIDVNKVLRRNVLRNDRDAEGDRLRMSTTPIVRPRHGQVVLKPDGRVVYTPNEGFNGSDRFDYSVGDVHGLTTTGRVSINVIVPVLIRAVGSELRDRRQSSIVQTSLKSPSLRLMKAVLQHRRGVRWADIRSGPATRVTQLVRPRRGEWAKGTYRIVLRHADRRYTLVRSEEFEMPAARGSRLRLHGDLTSLAKVEALKPKPKPKAKPTAKPKAKPKPEPKPRPPVFAPGRGAWGLWPLNANKPQLRRGARGDAVRYLQGVIAVRAGGNIKIDGKFESQTWYRVQQVQVFFRLTVDGRVGPETWKVIDFLAAG